MTRHDPARGTHGVRTYRGGRTARRVGCGVLSLVLLLIASVVGYGLWINHKVTGNITREDLLGAVTAPTASPSDLKVTREDGKEVERDASQDDPTDPERDPAAGDAQNILLIGEDSESGDDNQDRADVIVLMHIADDRSQVHLVHFPRDLYVNIPGHGHNKINASYAFGGAPLLVQTVQQQTGTQIDHVARTDFSSFKAMTDAVGGVDVYAEEPSKEKSGTIVKGMNHLDGELALEFVRERKQLSQGDVSRGRRQQAFIRALMLKALSPETLGNPARVNRFADAATQNIVVDQSWSDGDMRGLAFSLRGIRGNDIVFVTAPFNGLGWTDDRQSIVIKDPAQMKVLGEHLRTDTMDTYSDRERKF